MLNFTITTTTYGKVQENDSTINMAWNLNISAWLKGEKLFNNLCSTSYIRLYSLFLKKYLVSKYNILLELFLLRGFFFHQNLV